MPDTDPLGGAGSPPSPPLSLASRQIPLRHFQNFSGRMLALPLFREGPAHESVARVDEGAKNGFVERVRHCLPGRFVQFAA